MDRILRAREFDLATVKRALDVIDRNASAQLTLISDMLDMARISTGKVRLEMAELDPTTIALAAFDVVRPAADAKGVTLLTEIARNVPTVSADQDRLLQIIWNLLSNAVKFTERGGTVTLRIAREGAYVQLSVTDTGMGIEPEFLPQVFERFKQADASSARRHGGLGLGLALVRELAELHGGSVRVKSDGPLQGSTFTVLLPARTSAARVEKKKPTVLRQEVDSPLGGVHVLVVDDDPDAREIIVRSVTDVGASVTAVASVEEALARCAIPPTMRMSW
jgi:signal transduction histidine kinase